MSKISNMSGEEYKKWVNEAYQYIKDVYSVVYKLEHVNVGSTQYIPKINGEIELVFLGHDAHEGRGVGEELDITNAKERFYKGNGDPRYWRECPEWKIWNNIEHALKKVGFTEIIDNEYISDEILKKTIVTNALFFTYENDNEKELAKKLNSLLGPDIVNECMKRTGELIFEVIKPRMVICSSCSMVFEPLIKNYNADIKYEVFSLKGTSRKVMRCKHKDVTVLGIPHTSYPVPSPVAAFVRDSYLDNDIDYMISNIASQSNKLFVENKAQIRPEKLVNIMIEDSFKKLVGKELCEDGKSYKISPNFIVRVTSVHNGLVTIRDCKFKNGSNYIKEPIHNQGEIIEYLEKKRYIVKSDPERKTSLGYKPFRKYEEWKQGPQYVVLSILKEIDELGPELEEIYNKKDV